MPGYYTGQYCDNHLLAEWRLPIYWIFGATVFLGAGDVFHSVSNLSVSNLKPSYGLGLRIRVDKENNVNLRFDYALGKNISGFYVAFGEAF
jgi:hypothetical protein